MVTLEVVMVFVVMVFVVMVFVVMVWSVIMVIGEEVTVIVVLGTGKLKQQH
jgi:hypothetical protein